MSRKKIKNPQKEKLNPSPKTRKTALDSLHIRGIVTGYRMAIMDIEKYMKEVGEKTDEKTAFAIRYLLEPLHGAMKAKLGKL